ncbi:L-threonylcarbamoyladenylate synthase [Breznakiellaceae bacterium SP9]
MTLLGTSDADITAAAQAIREGRLVAFPTETVYGLGSDAFNAHAIGRIFAAKKRPFFDPLIIHIAERSNLTKVADLDSLSLAVKEKIQLLCQELWPGPLTLILPKKDGIPLIATSGLSTVAVRFPSHPIAHKLIARSTGAIAAPSANRFACLSPTCAEHVQEQLEEAIDFIIDGGHSEIGLESTILDIRDGIPRILRPGGYPKEAIEALVGQTFSQSGDTNGISAPTAPGQLKSHYAPQAHLFVHSRVQMLNLTAFGEEQSAFLFFDASSAKIVSRTLKHSAILSEKGDTTEAAANLFSKLHDLDKSGVTAIHAELAPDTGLGPAINDRLNRASMK